MALYGNGYFSLAEIKRTLQAMEKSNEHDRRNLQISTVNLDLF